MSLKIKTILSSLIFVIGSITFVNATEINMPGFTGTMNTTVTSGFSMRTERNCLSVRGEKTLGAADTGSAFANYVNSNYASTSSVYLDDGEGCAARYVDGYGNVGSANAGARDLISFNADNGRTNYDAGDIFDLTQRLYSEITGTTDAGTGVNISFVGRYNPLVDITGNPDFAPFNTDAQDEIETNIDLLNAYITQDVAAIDAELTAGRFVTSWGESTFIPIGMNGLTTNALDLTALRVPGSSIKEALMPTEQITLSGYMDNGWSYEAYYQFGESHVELEEDGQFFGSDAVNGTHVIFTGQFANNSHEQATACNYYWSVSQGNGCTAAAIANYNTAAGKAMSDIYYIQEGLRKVYSDTNATALAKKTATLGTGAASAWGGSGGEIPVIGLSAPSAIAAAGAAWDEYTRKGGVKRGSVDLTNSGHTYADGDDQYGFALRTYLDDVGTGVDLGIYFAQYDSKVPYLRFKGQQGVTSGDLLGLFTLASKMAEGEEATLATYLSAAVAGEAVTLTATETAGLTQLLLALAGSAYGEGACGAYQNPSAAQALYGVRSTPASNFAYSAAEKSNALTAYNYTAINGKLYHDSSKCAVNAAASNFNTAATQSAAAALLGAAITPLNVAEAEFIYPENIQVMAVSANTNIGGTTVQAEVAYRPNFPLATDAGDQGQQLSDATGATNLLSQAVAKGAFDASKTAVVEGAYLAGNGVAKSFADILMELQQFKRSTLPAISTATVAAGDYYTTPYIEYDTWTGTIGTTSTFTASHPITVGLGADSTVLLTELGIVHVADLDDNANGGVARGGYRDGVGGAKCGGLTKGAGNPTVFNSTKALDGMTHLGSSQTDPLFGNGSYCESQNSIDATSMTYRLIGSATYNNINNTAWTFSPSVVWSHDFSGYGPSSMGGFVPGKQSLSLGGSLSKGDVRASVNYVNQLGDEQDNLAFDMDYVSASVSYAF